jgi:hypothetical protein
MKLKDGVTKLHQTVKKCEVLVSHWSNLQDTVTISYIELALERAFHISVNSLWFSMIVGSITLYFTVIFRVHVDNMLA